MILGQFCVKKRNFRSFSSIFITFLQNHPVHPGLEHLQGLDSIFMKQRIDTLELFTGWQVQNKWKLSDPVTGDLIAAFKEDSECCQRQCCKNARAFKADISDSQGNVLFKMDRPFHCQCICCADACDGFCGQQITTLTSNNLVISRAVQESDCACPCWLDWKLAIYRLVFKNVIFSLPRQYFGSRDKF